MCHTSAPMRCKVLQQAVICDLWIQFASAVVTMMIFWRGQYYCVKCYPENVDNQRDDIAKGCK